MARSHVSAGRGRGAGVFARVSHRARAARAEALERRTLLAAAPLDASFGRGGVERVDFGGAADFVADVLPLPGVQWLAVGGGNGNVALARLNADGSLDRTFAATGGSAPTSAGTPATPRRRPPCCRTGRSSSPGRGSTSVRAAARTSTPTRRRSCT